MSNRRRSERYRIELPVWLKDSHGGEHTTTCDVSAHGIAVLTQNPRALRQYVELELHLSNTSRIGVTAMVARAIDEVELGDGRRGPGVGLDFFLFDSRAKVEWQKFMLRARTELASQNTEERVEASPGFDDKEPTEDEPEEEGTPTFIIKPRDLGRLWAFFRGELSKGTVRIETPIARTLGEPVELLVVHPSSQAEWTLSGKVQRTIEHGRGGRPVLEIGLLNLDSEARTQFRNFVATGQGMIEEEVPLSSELPVQDEIIARQTEPPEVEERARSVVINLEVSREEALVQPRPPVDLSLLDDEEPLFEEWLEPTAGKDDEPIRLPSSALSAVDPLDRDASDFDPAEQEPSTHQSIESESIESQSIESASIESASIESASIENEPLDRAPSEPTDETNDAPKIAIPEAPTEAAPTAAEVDAFDDDPEQEETEYRDFDVSMQVRPEDPLPALRVEPEVRPEPPAPPPSSESLSGRLFASFFFEAEAARPKAATIIPRAASGEQRPVSISSKSISARIEIKPPPLPKQPVPATAPAPAPPPERTPLPQPWLMTNRFQDPSLKKNGNTPQQPPPPPQRRPPAPQQRASFEESAKQSAHREVSTAGSDPSLDRDIALARARVVRTPNSVTACYRLSTLLMRRGEQDGFKEAIHTLQRVMELEPNHPGAHHAAAEALVRRGELDAAAEHLQRARRLGYRIDPELERVIASGKKG